MKIILIITLIGLLGCQAQLESNGEKTSIEEKEDTPSSVYIKQVRDCEYVFWYYSTGSMEHYEGCKNPIHKGNQ